MFPIHTCTIKLSANISFHKKKNTKNKWNETYTRNIFGYTLSNRHVALPTMQ